MKNIQLLSVALLMCFVVAAQSFGVPKDETQLRKSIMEASQKIQSIQCDFEQEKTSVLLTEKAKSKGEFVYKKTNKIRLAYTEPQNMLIIMRSGKLMVKDDDKTKELNLNRSKSFQQLNKIISESVNGSILTSLDFQSRLFESNSTVKVELSTVNKTLKNYISSIVIHLDKANFTATRLEMNEPNGDKMTLRFFNKKINEPVEEAVFTVEPPTVQEEKK